MVEDADPCLRLCSAALQSRKLRFAHPFPKDRWFLLGALRVELEQAGEDFVADFVGPAVAPGLFAFAAGGFFGLACRAVASRRRPVPFVIEDEVAGGGEVSPAVGGEDGGIHPGV